MNDLCRVLLFITLCVLVVLDAKSQEIDPRKADTRYCGVENIKHRSSIYQRGIRGNHVRI